jgi:hypothetical protein
MNIEPPTMPSLPKTAIQPRRQRFLQGLDPIAGETTELEVYGSHLK